VARHISPVHVALGRAVRQMRLGLGISQEELALQSRLQRKTIYHLETGRADPRYGTLRRVADVFGVRVADILVLADDLEARAGGRAKAS
jgi:transcriptional regulator with XRE-family HTH domain